MYLRIVIKYNGKRKSKMNCFSRNRRIIQVLRDKKEVIILMLLRLAVTILLTCIISTKRILLGEVNMYIGEDVKVLDPPHFLKSYQITKHQYFFFFFF